MTDGIIERGARLPIIRMLRRLAGPRWAPRYPTKEPKPYRPSWANWFTRQVGERRWPGGPF